MEPVYITGAIIVFVWLVGLTLNAGTKKDKEEFDFSNPYSLDRYKLKEAVRDVMNTLETAEKAQLRDENMRLKMMLRQCEINGGCYCNCDLKRRIQDLEDVCLKKKK